MFVSKELKLCWSPLLSTQGAHLEVLCLVAQLKWSQAGGSSSWAHASSCLFASRYLFGFSAKAEFKIPSLLHGPSPLALPLLPHQILPGCIPASLNEVSTLSNSGTLATVNSTKLLFPMHPLALNSWHQPLLSPQFPQNKYRSRTIKSSVTVHQAISFLG